MSFTVRRLGKDRPRRRIAWRPMIVWSLAILRPVLGWYHGWKKRKEEDEQRTMVLKRVLVVLVSVFFAFLLFAGVVKALGALRILGLSTLVSVAGQELPADADGQTNLLLLGQGDASHDGVDLTDTVMVASIAPGDPGSVVALSLPRDLYLLDTEKMGAGRINSLYRDYKEYLRRQGKEETEASEEAMRELGIEIGRALGMTIHHTIKIDFIAFRDIVDVVGGLDIEVPEDIEDMEYPDEAYGFDPFIIRAGPQHLDGATALKYARSRHTTSDFGRSARQQQLLVALAEKAKAEGLHKDIGAVTELLSILRKNVGTTMTVREMIALGGFAEGIDPSRVITMQLNDRNGLYGGFVEPGGFLYTPPRDLFGGAAVLLPVSTPEYPITWKKIQALTRLLLPNRALYLTKPDISILNAGARSGTARVLAGEFFRYGFNVPTIENAEIDDVPDSFVLARTPEEKATAEFFANLLQLPLRENTVGIAPELLGAATIVLGESYDYQPLQDLIREKTGSGDAL